MAHPARRFDIAVHVMTFRAFELHHYVTILRGFDVSLGMYPRERHYSFYSTEMGLVLTQYVGSKEEVPKNAQVRLSLDFCILSTKHRSIGTRSALRSRALSVDVF